MFLSEWLVIVTVLEPAYPGCPGKEATTVCLSLCASHLYVKVTHLFNGPFSRTTQVSRYQKGKNNLDFTEARDSEWQWDRSL